MKKKCTELDLSRDVTQAIVDTWLSQSRAISLQLLQRIVTQNKLLDVDWNFGVTSASSECDHVGKTFLQLKLVIAQDQSTKTIFLELSLDHFFSLLASLEKCKQFIDFVSPR